jgi:hypothetical protein
VSAPGWCPAVRTRGPPVRRFRQGRTAIGTLPGRCHGRRALRPLAESLVQRGPKGALENRGGVHRAIGFCARHDDQIPHSFRACELGEEGRGGFGVSRDHVHHASHLRGQRGGEAGMGEFVSVGHHGCSTHETARRESERERCPCENPTTAGARSARCWMRCPMSAAQLVKVRPGAGAEAPRPGRSTLTRRMPDASTVSPPNPSHLLVAAPGRRSAGVLSTGPHSAQPRCLLSGSRVRPSRAGSRTP